MISQFAADTADEVWRAAAAALIDGDEVYQQKSRNGSTRELLHATFVLRKPRQRWVLSRRPALNPAFAIAETVWILQGRDDAAFLNFWNPVLPAFAGRGLRYHGAYGARLRSNLGFDQLERAYLTLLHNPDSRQAVLQIWDGRHDCPDERGAPRDMDIPCNVVAMPKLRDGKLEWMQVMRSNDLFRGTPHNFIQFTVMQEVMAGWFGVDPGSYVHVADSLHFYETDLPQLTMANPQPTSVNTESLALRKDDFDRMLPELGQMMDRLRADGLSRSEFWSLVQEATLPAGWQSSFCIASADAARRRGWREEMELAASRSENAMLNEAWANWLDRKSAEHT